MDSFYIGDPEHAFRWVVLCCGYTDKYNFPKNNKYVLTFSTLGGIVLQYASILEIEFEYGFFLPWGPLRRAFIGYQMCMCGYRLFISKLSFPLMLSVAWYYMMGSQLTFSISKIKFEYRLCVLCGGIENWIPIGICFYLGALEDTFHWLVLPYL